MRADDDHPHLGAWERFYAKEVDGLLSLVPTALLLFPLAARFEALALSGVALLAYAVVRILVWGLAELILLPTFGATPGRWLLGLRVEAKAGGRASLGAAAIRTPLLAIFGLGLWLPLFPLVGMLAGIIQLDNFRTTLWDRLAGTTVIGPPAPFWRLACGAAAWVINSLATFTLGWLLFRMTPGYDVLMSV